MKKKVIIWIVLVFVCCNPFSNEEEKAKLERESIVQQKEEEEEKQQQEAEEEQKLLVDANKEFKYLCELISYKTNVTSDTVSVILKEYYIENGNVLFDNDLNIIKQEYRITSDDGNFVEDIISKYNFPRKTFFLVYHEIFSYFIIREIYNKLEYLEESVIMFER